MISAALWIIVKVSVLMGLAAVVQAVVHQRTSAATRHLIWTLAIVSVLVLPILSVVLPQWAVIVTSPTPTGSDASRVVVNVESPAAPLPASPSLAGPAESGTIAHPPVASSLPTQSAAVYGAGVLVMLMYTTIQRRRVRRLAYEATEVRDHQWTRLLRESATSLRVHRSVRLLRNRECSMPMAVGVFRPAILIPAISDTWPEDRRRAVLLHELAHVARYDCLTQSLAFVACTLYWFHPAAWWVARRLRIERELACDDRVIASGAEGRDYASHLLEIAYSLGRYRAPALAVTMARPRQLEGRMLAALDGARKRDMPSMRVHLAAAVIAAGVLFPLASATAAAMAMEPGPDRTSATAAPMSAPDQDSGLYLKAWSWIQSSRLVRAATEVIGIAQNGLAGTWEIRPTSTEGTVHLRLVEWNSSSGSNIPIRLLEGLTAAQLAGSPGPVQFRLRRDAGTFTFEGVVRNGVGAGTFSFTPDATFPAELAKRGFARPTAVEQYQLARHDMGYTFVDELNKQGYGKPQTSDLVRAGQHGVNVEYLRDMSGLGYRLGTLDPLIQLRDHGVTPGYVRELSGFGYKGLPADDLRQARDHGITPDYVRGMRDAGYTSLSMEQLINARDHGVTPEYVRGLGELGHRNVVIDQVIRVRDHGVDVEFARGMASLGYSGLSLDGLVRLRDHGVTPQYAQELKTLGYDSLSADDLVTLRDYGLTPDRIRAANMRARTRLPVDLLKRLAAGGMQ